MGNSGFQSLRPLVQFCLSTGNWELDTDALCGSKDQGVVITKKADTWGHKTETA